jgi:ankyrin repeat protein
MAKWLLDKKFDSILQDSDGDTALHVAARRGEEKAVLLLLDYRMDANAQNKYGQTPFHLAAIFKQESVARILLGRGAD